MENTNGLKLMQLWFMKTMFLSYQSNTSEATQQKKSEKIIEDTLIQERQLNN